MDMINGSGSRGDLRIRESSEPESELFAVTCRCRLFHQFFEMSTDPMGEECSGVEALFVMHSSFQWEALVGN